MPPLGPEVVVEAVGGGELLIGVGAMKGEVYRGRVKFFRSEKGWGGIESGETPGDGWVHFSVIDADGYRELVQGEAVEFRYVPQEQDSWRYVATWVRRLPPEPSERD
jgi:CspA family cold shock protein